MYWLIVIGIPVVAVCAAALGLHFLDSVWVVRFSNVSIGVQVTAALVAFVLPRTMSDTRKYGGAVCPDFDSGQGHAMEAIAFGSIAFGAVALASSFIAVRREVARRALASWQASARPLWCQ